MRRIFLERGLDFFEAEKGARHNGGDSQVSEKEEVAPGEEDVAEPSHHMTPEELHKMRMEVMNTL